MRWERIPRDENTFYHIYSQNPRNNGCIIVVTRYMGSGIISKNGDRGIRDHKAGSIGDPLTTYQQRPENAEMRLNLRDLSTF